MHRDEISPAIEFIEFDKFDVRFCCNVGTQERIVGNDSHVQAQAAAGYFPTDLAKTNDPQGLLLHLDSDELLPFPFPPHEAPVGLRDISRQ